MAVYIPRGISLGLGKGGIWSPVVRPVYIANTLDTLHFLHRRHPTSLLALPPWTLPHHMRLVRVPVELLCSQGSVMYFPRALNLIRDTACSKLLLDDCLIHFSEGKGAVEGHEWVTRICV